MCNEQVYPIQLGTFILFLLSKLAYSFDLRCHLEQSRFSRRIPPITTTVILLKQLLNITVIDELLPVIHLLDLQSHSIHPPPNTIDDQRMVKIITPLLQHSLPVDIIHAHSQRAPLHMLRSDMRSCFRLILLIVDQ